MIFNLSWVYLTPTWVWEMCSGYGCNRLAQCLSKLFRGLKHHETDAVMDTRRQQRGSSWKGWTVRRSRNEWTGKACFHYRNFEIKCLMGVNLTFFMKLHRSGHVYITYICDVRCQVILCMQVLFICMGSVLLHIVVKTNKHFFFFTFISHNIISNSTVCYCVTISLYRFKSAAAQSVTRWQTVALTHSFQYMWVIMTSAPCGWT